MKPKHEVVTLKTWKVRMVRKYEELFEVQAGSLDEAMAKARTGDGDFEEREAGRPLDSVGVGGILEVFEPLGRGARREVPAGEIEAAGVRLGLARAAG